MSGNPVLPRQTTSISIQVPTRESLAAKRLVVPAAFALIIILFFFNFCDFRIGAAMGEAEYGANANAGKPISGFDFITGTSLPTTGVGNNVVAGLLGIKNEQANGLQKVSFNIWAALAMIAAIAGVYVFWRKDRNESLYGLMLAAAGIAALLMLLVSSGKYEERIDAGFIVLQTRMVFQFAYWLAFTCFAVAGFISYLRFKASDPQGIVAATNEAAKIHVNIITREADAAGKI
jgi:hypothetical protein